MVMLPRLGCVTVRPGVLAALRAPGALMLRARAAGISRDIRLAALRAREGNRIELDVTMVEASLDAVAGLPPGAKLDSVKMQGGGTSNIRLDRLVPTGSIEADLELGLSITAEGQTQNMGMHLKMQQAIAPLVP